MDRVFGGALMGNRRYHAPQDNGAILADPARNQWAKLTQLNRSQLVETFQQQRDAARDELATLLHLPTTPVGFVVTGHQPELCHPGVWVKNFALNHLAKETGLVPLNLIVDNDTHQIDDDQGATPR